MTQSAAKPRTEVSIAGRLASMSILGSTVVFIITLENTRSAWLAYALPILAAGLVLAVLVPLLFFRRPVA